MLKFILGFVTAVVGTHVLAHRSMTLTEREEIRDLIDRQIHVRKQERTLGQVRANAGAN